MLDYSITVLDKDRAEVAARDKDKDAGAAETSPDLVQAGIASVQSAVTRNHMSLVNVASTAPVQNAGRR
jgi:hypothetical protein